MNPKNREILQECRSERVDESRLLKSEKKALYRPRYELIIKTYHPANSISTLFYNPTSKLHNSVHVTSN